MKKVLSVLVSLFMFSIVLSGQSIPSQDITEIKNYSEIIKLFESDCYGIGEALGAQYTSITHIPKSGWLFTIENAGHPTLEEIINTVQFNLTSLDFLLFKEYITDDTKIFISYRVLGGPDYILVFNAKELDSSEKWKVYKGKW